MDEQEQLSTQAPEAPATVTPNPDAEMPTMTVRPAVSMDDVNDGGFGFGDDTPEPAPQEPAAEDASYAQPVPSGAIGALLDQMHMAVEYAGDEVKDTVRGLVSRLRDMI